MRDRLIALMRSIPNMESQCRGRAQGKTYLTAAHIADHLLANGVIVPPCKVGDTVYSIVEGINNIVFVGDVYEYTVGREHFVFRSTRKGYLTLAFTELDIGKTVFLTSEEAEKALAERSGE